MTTSFETVKITRSICDISMKILPVGITMNCIRKNQSRRAWRNKKEDAVGILFLFFYFMRLRKR